MRFIGVKVKVALSGPVGAAPLSPRGLKNIFASNIEYLEQSSLDSFLLTKRNFYGLPYCFRFQKVLLIQGSGLHTAGSYVAKEME